MIKSKEMKFKEFTKLLKKNGFELHRIGSGHVIYKNNQGKTFAVPNHRKVETGILWQFNKIIKK